MALRHVVGLPQGGLQLLNPDHLALVRQGLEWAP